MPKKQKKDYEITHSDWLQYLESIASMNESFSIGFLSLVFIVLIMLLTLSISSEIPTIPMLIIEGITLVFLLWVMLKIFKVLKEGRRASKLLRAILVEERKDLQTLKGIKSAWKKELKKIRK